MVKNLKTKQKFVKSAVVFILLGLFVSVSIIQFSATARFGITGADGYVRKSSDSSPISGALVTLKVDGIVQDIDYTYHHLILIF